MDAEMLAAPVHGGVMPDLHVPTARGPRAARAARLNRARLRDLRPTQVPRLGRLRQHPVLVGLRRELGLQRHHPWGGRPLLRARAGRLVHRLLRRRVRRDVEVPRAPRRVRRRGLVLHELHTLHPLHGVEHGRAAPEVQPGAGVHHVGAQGAGAAGDAAAAGHEAGAPGARLQRAAAGRGLEAAGLLLGSRLGGAQRLVPGPRR
mmetsp:Transcript_33321/g.92844  ORF Transcript_33321/g.92844 Transcript_33321/m.92844 type:complete len:204 (+) Transcript_33321:157-768(+)